MAKIEKAFKEDMKEYNKNYKKPSCHVVDWDLDRMMKAVNSPSVTVPDNITEYATFREWILSLTDKDFKAK